MRPEPITVTYLNRYIKEKVAEDEYLQYVYVKGEISNFKHHYTGHMYFTLKDENSLIKSKLEDITKSWDNVLEKRLITVEEIKDTGLTTDVPAVMFDGSTVINTQVSSWLINEQELYWTMSKGELTEQYVYVVMNGMLQGHIVGYALGSQWNLDGTFFSNFGIRPVIEVDKSSFSQ